MYISHVASEPLGIESLYQTTTIRLIDKLFDSAVHTFKPTKTDCMHG